MKKNEIKENDINEEKKKNKKVKKEKRVIDKIKLIKKITKICIIVIFIELIAFVGYKIYRDIKVDYLDVTNDIIEIPDGYITVGYSNFKNSHFVNEKKYTYTDELTNKKKTIIATQSRIAKYDKDMHLIWEKTFDCDYNSSFSSIIKVDDGYIAVGSYNYNYEQIEEGMQDGLIVKYDTDGKMIWFKNYQLLGKTSFTKIIKSEDDYIVVGQSIYENLRLGNHVIGGGIIIRYNENGDILEKNNYGGNKSGLFNDIVEVEDGYIVCGKDGTNYGVVVKYPKHFNRDEEDLEVIPKNVTWNKTYSNTDENGFTNIEINDKTIYVTGAINISDEKDEKGNIIYSYDAGIVTYDLKGNYLNKYTFGGSKLDRYNSMIIDGKNIIAVGITESSDIDIENYPNYDTTTGIIVKYDLDCNIIKKIYYGGNKNDVINNIKKIKNNYIVLGSSNSNSFIDHDYHDLIKFYNSNLKKDK